jgi:hypothetical protein
MKKLVIRNQSRAGLAVIVEPIFAQEDVGPGKSVSIEGTFADDDELVIDIGPDNSVSVWALPVPTIRVQ